MQQWGMNNQKALSPEQLLALLEATIRDATALDYGGALTESDLRWLGRADAILEASGSISALVSFRTARTNLKTLMHSRDKIMLPLHDAYSRVELRVPSASQGAFIPAGDTWNGYAAIVKLIQRDCGDLVIVDPYLNSTLYIEFAPHATAQNGIRCLTTQRAENHSGLVAAATRWASETKPTARPVEVRYASSGALHDRLIIIDGKEVWLVSQSIKDIAKRSPASVSRADPELALMKAQHYQDLWATSAPLA